MKQGTWAPGALLLMLALAAVPPARAEQDPSFDRTMLAAVNAVRAQHRLPPVRLDRRLTAAASAYALELAQRRDLAHVGRDGSNPRDRATRQGYVSVFVTENLAATPDDAGGVVERWMGSTNHRANLLLPDARDIGAARETPADPGNPYRHYDVLVIARPLR